MKNVSYSKQAIEAMNLEQFVNIGLSQVVNIGLKNFKFHYRIGSRKVMTFLKYFKLSKPLQL